MGDLPLREASTHLRDHFGVPVEITNVVPLKQWTAPVAYRLSLKWESLQEQCPDTVIMKWPYSDYDPSDLGLWRPAWRVTRDFTNLKFLQQVGAGEYVPDVYGFDKERGLLLMEDLGELSLHKMLAQPRKPSAGETVVRVAETLGRLHGRAFPYASEFASLIKSYFPDFVILPSSGAKLDEKDPYTFAGIHKHFGKEYLPETRRQIEQFAQYDNEADRFSGYVLGDIWHQHVLLCNRGVCFIDCGFMGRKVNMISDIMRLVDGTPLYELKEIPDEIVQTAKQAYLEAFTGTVGMELSSELREAFERSYASALVSCCFSICSREWLHLKRDYAFTWHVVREAMLTAQRVLEISLPEFPALIELASLIRRWFESNRPESAKSHREIYEALS